MIDLFSRYIPTVLEWIIVEIGASAGIAAMIGLWLYIHYHGR